MTIDPWVLATIIGMTAMTIVTRAFFFIPKRPWPMPHWAERGLQYAPVAALAGVIAPELVMSDGHLITTWQDARLFAAAVALGWYAWRRSVLGTILVGMAVYLPLHIGLRW